MSTPELVPCLDKEKLTKNHMYDMGQSPGDKRLICNFFENKEKLLENIIISLDQQLAQFLSF